MAFIRNCFIAEVLLFCILLNAKAQNVYYPAHSSQLLMATAEDAAMLLQKAVAGSHFTAKVYNTMPASGIIFIYDTTIKDNQACKIESNGFDQIKLSAYGDNGLGFGIYQFLHQMGFRFYQPGTVWEIIPSLTTVFKKSDTTYTCSYKYKSWFISGGHRKWVMDSNGAYDDWEGYSGDNGHNWALYQRRNGMVGSAGFHGHRDDIMSGNYLATLQNNPCYVANFNGSRQANIQSVPDIYNTTAKELWANAIEQQYTQYKNIIFSNPTGYANIYNNIKSQLDNIGIEVPDGGRWGNSKENEVCSAIDYPKESDQNFTLANFTAQKILAKYPGKHFQVYAYSVHADVPSASITINKNIDIQLVPTVYQMESSVNGLRNRWYNRYQNISEYLYLNLSGWSGETPSFNWSDLKRTLQIAKEKKSQGIMWEASPAKFGSLPFLLAANNYLKEDIAVDSTLKEFCNNMFAGASNTVYKIFQMFGDEKTAIDKYKMQLYIQLLNTAVQQTQNASPIVKDRLRELKAYLHYMVLYFDLANDEQQKTSKSDKDAAKCIYLAKTNKLQLVNSYYLIISIVSKYATTSDFYLKYNIFTGTAYQNGNLALISSEEIDNNFLQDFSKFSNQLEQFKFEEAAYTKSQFKTANIAPVSKINTKLIYTNGLNYYNTTSFNIIAPSAGSFTIKYTPSFGMPGKGYINFVVEATDETLKIIKDFSLDNNSTAGAITIDLPKAGNYILAVVSKFKSAVDLSITTNGNYFYKDAAFLGNKTESYAADLSSLPGYFYIPSGLSKIYFFIGNSFAYGRFASAEEISRTFLIKDNNGNPVQARFGNPKDSSLFYLEVPEGAAGNFWQATTMAQYNLQFVNISNTLWYAQRTACSNANFTAAIVSKNGNCFTQLTSTANAANLNWEVNDKGSILKYSNQSVIDLQGNISLDAVVTLNNGTSCSYTKRLGNDPNYLSSKEACTLGAVIAGRESSGVNPVMYPNPSKGVFNCMQNGNVTTADEVVICNIQGIIVGSFKNVKQFNISNIAAGLYFYRIIIKGTVFKGKVIKL